MPQTSSQPQPLPNLALPGHGEQDDAASAGSPGRHEDAFLNLSRKLLCCFFRH